MVIDLLKKDIKIDRKIIILFVIFNFLIMGLYYTYSIFVIRQLKEDVSLIAVNTKVLSMQSSSLTDNKITVSAGTSQAIDITVTNPATIKMYYRIMHEGVPTGVSIYETNSDNTSYGEIAASGSITSSITINNTTASDVTITFLLQESYDELFDKVKIEETYPFKLHELWNHYKI